MIGERRPAPAQCGGMARSSKSATNPDSTTAPTMWCISGPSSGGSESDASRRNRGGDGKSRLPPLPLSEGEGEDNDGTSFWAARFSARLSRGLMGRLGERLLLEAIL